MLTNDINAKRKYRAKLFRDATSFKRPERVPHLGSIVSWKILDAGYKYSEAFNDYDIFDYCTRRCLDIYKLDALLGDGYCMPFKVLDVLGGGYLFYRDDPESIGSYQFNVCEFDELEEYAVNPTKVMWEYSAPRKFKRWNEFSLNDYQKSVDEYIENNTHYKNTLEILNKEYGIPQLVSQSVGGSKIGVEVLFSYVRGIKGLSLDMRRNFEKVKDICRMMDEKTIQPFTDKIRSLEYGPDIGSCFDVGVTLLAHTIMNAKQFSELYWPSLKQIFDAAQSRGKQARISLEGSGMHLFDFFSEYNKGLLALHLEQDDIWQTREKLPNCALIGGMPVTKLGNCTSEECVDYAKKLIDELGSNGGFIFGENKFMSFRNDAKSENMKAVCDFVYNYRY